jgi:hypothetical protein
MVRRISHIAIVLILLFASAQIFGQRHVFSEVRVNQSNPYVGQPVEVSLSIYTSTWFTQGVNFGNIKVNGAFTVFFRSVPSSKKINGKNYSGVTAIYNVFPYDNKDVVFPSLEFTVETPREGDYKGVPVKVKTTERVIRVKSIPKGIESNTWLVANGLNLSENWQGNEKSIKVGDVLERKVTRKAYGTVAELIPPLIWDSIPGVSNYALRSEVSNEKTKTSIYSVRSEGTRYLFEKEGSVTIPAIEVTWWNPAQKKLFKRTLPAKSFEVLPNPDLGMLESVRDSLSVDLEEKMDSTEESDDGIIGLSRRQIIFLTLAVILLIKGILKIYKYVFVTKMLAKRIREKRRVYKESEAYFFKRFKSCVKGEDTGDIIEKLYQWIDRLELKEPTFHVFAKIYGNEQLMIFADEFSEDFDIKELKKQLVNIEKARKKYLQGPDIDNNSIKPQWINP